MSLETRLKFAIKRAVELQQHLEKLAEDIPAPLHERAERLSDRADDLSSDIAELLHHVDVWQNR